MESVAKEQLTGYRQPTEYEKSGIQKYILKDLKGAQRVYKITAMTCGISAAALLWFAGISIVNHELEVIKVVVVVGFAFLLLVFFAGSVNICRKNKALILDVRYGRFEVLDCVSEDIDPACDIAGLGFASICTGDGKCCSDRFHIDLLTASEYKGQKGIPMLLMRQFENQYYELFTAYKMNGGQ